MHECNGAVISCAGWILLVILLCLPSIALAGIDVEMRLNDNGYISFDHFKAELVIDTDELIIQNVQLFGILEIEGEYFYWPTFRNEIDYETRDSIQGVEKITLLEFDLPDVDGVVPFGPMYFWGGWFENAGNNGFDVRAFWLGSEYRVPRCEYIPAGSFTMGSPSDEPGRGSDEMQHEVTLTHGFYMLQTEVTRQMWADLKALQPTLPDDPSCIPYSPTMRHPVQSITWYEAVLFSNLMSLRDGYTQCYFIDGAFTIPVDSTNYRSGTVYCHFHANGYRLPTESEWEYACRAGTTTAFSCDETNYNDSNAYPCASGTYPTLERYCVYCANDPGTAEPAGSRLANPWNLKDMHGNVWEWCWDWYGYDPSGSVTDPTGPISGSNRVFRGGGWNYDAGDCRSAGRRRSTPDYRYNRVGFRFLRSSE